MQVTMSGKCFEAALATSDFLPDRGVPAPVWRRVGTGRQACLELTEEQFDDLVWHVQTLLASLDGEYDTGPDCAAMRSWLTKYAPRS